MKVLRAKDYRRMPWKNGKGETVEITVFPADASVSDFGWRVSMAPVVSDGAFSSFEEIDRTLSILAGEGMRLSVEGMESVVLGTGSAPFSFPGDAATDAVLTQGPITDLNVMTRRGIWKHLVSLRPSGGPIGPAKADATLALALRSCRVVDSGIMLGPLDALLFEKGDPDVALQPSDSSLYIIDIFAV